MNDKSNVEQLQNEKQLFNEQDVKKQNDLNEEQLILQQLDLFADIITSVLLMEK